MQATLEENLIWRLQAAKTNLNDLQLFFRTFKRCQNRYWSSTHLTTLIYRFVFSNTRRSVENILYQIRYVGAKTYPRPWGDASLTWSLGNQNTLHKLCHKRGTVWEQITLVARNKRPPSCTKTARKYLPRNNQIGPNQLHLDRINQPKKSDSCFSTTLCILNHAVFLNLFSTGKNKAIKSSQMKK